MASQETLVPKKRGPKPKGAVGLNVRVPPDQIAALDRFIAEEASGISRPEGMRRLMVEALQKMGLYPVGKAGD